MKSRSGFSLIELLIVVAILAIVSIIALQVFGVQQPKARDAKRLADIDLVYNYLERYMVEEGEYPQESNFEDLKDLFADRYLSRFGDMKDPGNFSYTYRPDGVRYCLCVKMERSNLVNSGADCAGGAQVKDHYCRKSVQ